MHTENKKTAAGKQFNGVYSDKIAGTDRQKLCNLEDNGNYSQRDLVSHTKKGYITIT